MRLLVDKDTFFNLISRQQSGAIQKVAAFQRSSYYVLLFSQSGIMRRINGTLENVVIKDGKTRLIKFNNHEFIGDGTSVTYVTNCETQLPTRVTEVPITLITYRKYKNSVVSLKYEVLNNGAIRDAWFDIDDAYVDNVMSLEDVDSFLSG